MKRGLYQLAVVIALLAVGCSNGTDSGEIFSPESGHRTNWVDPAFIGTAEFHGSAVQVGGATRAAAAGETLYAQNCAACHGSDASGGIGPNVQGKSAADITQAITTVAVMQNLTLDTTETQDIADFLATLSGGSAPTTVQIDATVCTVCHGDDLDGGIANVSCFACHNGPTGAVGHPTTWLERHDPTHFHGRYAHKYGIACTACHSQALTGGIGPSCFRCHDPEELQDILADIRDSAG